MLFTFHSSEQFEQLGSVQFQVTSVLTSRANPGLTKYHHPNPDPDPVKQCEATGGLKVVQDTDFGTTNYSKPKKNYQDS